MSLTLHNLKANKQKNRKRVGRGNASGHGTYSTRGLKGQKSRSGVSGLKRLGMKKMILSAPKERGFKSLNPKMQIVKLESLNDRFKSGAVISPSSLFKAGLIAKMNVPVKILSNGELKLENLIFSNLKFSQSALESIKKQKGVIKEAKKNAVKKVEKKVVKSKEIKNN
ncbi:MAG: 50S ribosomal protein L15 [bacterium]